ncbi:hypothetical protein M413DRAFT_9931 [Hebeloma cylindrosporum]|uniref:Uncharacterized protein n=1 Tax=Hebeloma cylindrosporum TaxID=76867 RepID=A0A0C2YQA4_HEBCY|nr:hypothetical protein M413DRAFT_9931 [Hebeloma cylindrosporum h7]
MSSRVTRRKSKATTAEHDEENPDGHHPLNVTIPEDIDEDALTTLLPDINLAALNFGDVVSIYRLLLSQSSALDATERERDETRAELERKEVELDQALQDKESLAKDMETSAESVHEELAQVKRECDQLAAAKTALQTQISTLSSSQSLSSTEVETLKQRVVDTEREKRELVGVISRLKDESSQRDEEINTLRTNLKEARQEHQALEAQVRELRSTETTTKFKIDSLSQQLQLSQTEAERANTELSSKTEEFAKYRRLKHAEVATLQASFDSLTQSYASSEASLKALNSAHTAQAHQLTQALSKVQGLTGQLAEQEARYSNEASGLKRLVSMMEEREKQAKEIVDNIERDWATVGEKAERREAALKDEIEKERKGREESEMRLEQLEGVLERMGRGELPIPGRNTPSTPFRAPGTSDFMVDGMMGLSPTVAMASKSQRTGKTFTEVYADYVRLQEEYSKKSAEYDHMDRTLSSVLAQIEERAPILSQQRIEYERLQVEASQLGSQLAQAIAERDSQTNLAQGQSQKLAKSIYENELLQKQLEDLGQQVQTLLREIERRDDPTIPSDEDLEYLAADDTQALISNNLVRFRSIGELQAQNERLLKIVRDLGEKMEGEERDYREAMEKEQAEAIKEAHEAMQELAAQLERQKKSSDTIIQAYVKERDTLRGMLARAEKGGNSHRVTHPTSEVTADPGSDLAKELLEIQGQFEAYKTETNYDSGRLRDELMAAQREVNQVSAALAKANAKVEFLSGKHPLLMKSHFYQFRVHNAEIDELAKRNTVLHEQRLRYEVQCTRLADELQVALLNVETLRNEGANLRAEKKIWESVQDRLVEENRSLAMERSHLSDLMSNVQKMHNDLERSGENDRRRLESQLQMLEGQTQDLRAQVVQERDSARQISLQKELELKELQARLEKKAQEFAKTREALVEAQTSRKHLEEKVEGLTRQLKGNEEKLSVYERRPASDGVTQIVDKDASREQQLEAEVAELRSALKVAEVDLVSARSHRDQYQEISQASEAALVGLNTTFDEYKRSTEAQIARHESETQALQERLEQTSKELAEVRAQHNDAQKSFEVERITWISDKKTLEDTIVDMSTSEKHSESDRSSREQELRNLEERAKSAEQKYSHEVIAHAESMKAIDNLKKDLGEAQAAAREQRSASDTAQAKLLSSESSWRHQKDALEKEVEDLKTRLRDNFSSQDLSQQNALLHQHLESVSAQATRIRQASDAPLDSNVEGGEPTEDSDNRLSELRSVVNYLRKEKGIVDLQLEMSKRENEVLKSKIEHLSQTLQETRTALAEERERAIENTASAAQHADLLTELTNSISYAKKARDLEIKLKALSQELDPAKEQARSAQAELEASKVQIGRLEQESRRWQERNAQLLSKYDRVVPSEVQALRDEITRLTTEASEVQEQAEAKDIRIQKLEDTMKGFKEQVNRSNTSFRAKLGELNGQKSALSKEKKELETRIATLEEELASLRSSQASNSEGNTVATAHIQELQKQNGIIASLRAECDKLISEKDALTKAHPTSVEAGAVAPTHWEAEKAQLVKSRDEALEKVKIANAEVQKISADLRNIKLQNNTDAEKQAAAVSEAVQKAKAEMASDTGVQEDISKRHAEELKALEQKLKADHESELKARIEAALKSRPAPAENSADQQAAIDAALAEYEKKLQQRHNEEIASAVERGRMEQGAKAKLKDSQLVKAQKRVKDLEAQIHEWQAAGIVLPPTPAASTTVAAAPAQAPGAVKPAPSGPPQAPTAAAGPSQPKPNPAASAVAAASAANLPRRPPANTPGTQVSLQAGRGGAVRGVGRGGFIQRGGAPLRQPPVRTAPTAPAATQGVSIIGAAKRPREESPATTEDSLAKRLKPAQPS